MFATLLGALPRPPVHAGAPTAVLVEAAVRAQEAAGLEPLTDGGSARSEGIVEAWRLAAGFTDRAVKQAVLGPYTQGRTIQETVARSTALNAELRALAAAGCPLIEVHEPAATLIGLDEAERARFRAAHLRLLDGLDGTHLSLAITGGNAHAAGIPTLLAAPYDSLALDLVAGPENWRLVVATPGDRGIVCGALSVEAADADSLELLLWAAAYAASTAARGPGRVGLASAGSLEHLDWERALRKLARLGDAAQTADLPPDALRRAMDPRAVDIRSAARGRVVPRPPLRPRADDADET